MRTQCLSANTPLICRKEFWVCVLKGMPRSRLVSGNMLFVQTTFYFHAGILVSFIKSSLTFTIDYCTFSNALFYDVINGSIKRFPTGFHTYTQTHCIYSLSQEKAEQFSLYFRLLYNRATSPTYLFTKESITNLLKLPFLELYADYYSTVKEHKVTTLHKEEIGLLFSGFAVKALTKKTKKWRSMPKSCMFPPNT